MKSIRIFGLLAFAALCACSNNSPPRSQTTVGSDRDPHGCIPSAGYSWCARTKQCERPWELAKENGFGTTPEAFEEFCRLPANANGT